MEAHPVIDAIRLAALTAQEGGGGLREARALVVVNAALAASNGSAVAKLKAAWLMNTWRRRYERP